MVRVVRFFVVGALAASVSVVVSAVGSTQAATGDPVLINAALVSTTGTDPEYVELFGVPGTSLAGLSVIGVESDAGASNGAIDHRFDLPADAEVGDNGYFLLANGTAAAAYGITPNFSIGENALENSSITLALVETASITGTTAATVGVVKDAVALTDGGVSDTFFFGAPTIGPDATFIPAGARRTTAGVDTDTAADWTPLDFNVITAPINIPTAGTGGGSVDPVEAFIHEVQGDDVESPLLGDDVIVEGIVTDDREGPVTGGMRGFFMQEEETDVDADPVTSEGLFVFNGSNDSVSVGDIVRVTGTVAEFRGLTEISPVASIEVISAGNPAPTPATIEFPVPAVSALEAYEAMIATLPQELMISEYFNYDRFGEVVVALPAPGEARPMTPTAVFAPDTAAAAERADLNRRSRITIDDGISTENPETVVHPITRDVFTLDNAFRGGDVVTGLTGPIFEGFGLYRVLPFSVGGYATYEKNLAPAAPEPVGGSLRVASMNTLNYFLTLNTGAPLCGPLQTLECRGANDANEFQRQRDKLLNALEGLEADVIGLNELENRPGVEPLADIANGLNERFGAGTYDYVVAGDNSVIGTDAIKVGLVYRRAAVTPVGAAAVLDTPAFVNPNNGTLDRNRAAVAQTFRDNATGEVFSVTINHLKSKGSACPEDGGQIGLAGNCDATRTAAAGVLASWIAGNPTGVADTDWLIIGDLNSYDHEAPIGVLESAGFTDLAKQFHGEYAYSYVFDGQSGYLDYSLASSSIRSQVTGMTDWHINSDELDLVDYDTTFKSNYQDTLFDPTSPGRSSDHDAVVVGLQLDSKIKVTASPDTLWLPLRQMVPIGLTAKGARNTSYTVTPLSGVSNELDSGLGRFDLPNDIQIANAKLKLRAEVFGCPARIYTVEVQAAGGGQVVFKRVTVRVPNLLGILFGCRF